MITISGVGFDEVEPMISTGSRIFTMSLIGLGMLSVAFTLGSFVQFLTESEIIDYLGRHRMTKQIQTLTGPHDHRRLRPSWQLDLRSARRQRRTVRPHRPRPGPHCDRGIPRVQSGEWRRD